MSSYLLHNMRLLDPKEGRCLEGRKVLVEDGRFAAVGTDVAAPEGVAEVDLGGRVLMPGLIDCHVHVLSIKTKWANNTLMHMPHSLANAGAARKMRAILSRGFTTVRDAAGADMGHRDAVEQGLVIGPRMFVSGRGISQTGGHGDFRTRVEHAHPCGCHHLSVGLMGGIARIADGIDEVRRAVRDEIRLGVDQVKIFASGGVGSDADPIHFNQFSLEEMRAIVEEAENGATYAMAHAYTAEAIDRAVTCGIRTIEHGNFLDDASAELMVRHDAHFVPTLVAYEATQRHGREQGYPEQNLVKNAKVLAVGTQSLEVARRLGVKTAFGTDLMGELDDYQSLEFEIRARVLPSDEIIRQATINGAAVLRREGELGEIAPGALADAIVLDGNPLDDIGLLASGGADMRAIIKDGKIYKDEIGLGLGLEELKADD